MRAIVVGLSEREKVSELQVELVERKGIGHPDSLIDGIVEEISRQLSKYYIEMFGKILHHNVDKGQLCGGRTEVEFGGGEFLKPIYILLSGRATEDALGKKIPTTHIAIEATKNYLKKTTRYLNVDVDVEIDSRISQGSDDLVDLFLRGPKVPYANDTSFGIGFAPFTPLEQLVLSTEALLNSKAYKESHPEVGEDVKIMGMRNGDSIKLTVAAAFVSKHIPNVDTYIKRKEEVRRDIIKNAESVCDNHVDVFFNTADNEKNSSVYITLTGLSAEMGDDGSVGRGNRVSGLITPMRSMTLEAAAGKNPVNHVGKIYSVLAFEIAREIIKEYPDVGDCTVSLLSQIGKPIDKPKMASAVVHSDKEIYEKYKDRIEYIIDKNLENITDITMKIANGDVSVF